MAEEHSLDQPVSSGMTRRAALRHITFALGTVASAGLVEGQNIAIDFAKHKEAERKLADNLGIPVQIKFGESHVPDLTYVDPNKLILCGETKWFDFLDIPLEEYPEQSEFKNGVEYIGQDFVRAMRIVSGQPSYIFNTDANTITFPSFDTVLTNTKKTNEIPLRTRFLIEYGVTSLVGFSTDATPDILLKKLDRRTFLKFAASVAAGTLAGRSMDLLKNTINSNTDLSQLSQSEKEYWKAILPYNHLIVKMRNLSMVNNTYALKSVLPNLEADHLFFFAANGHKDIVDVLQKDPENIRGELQSLVYLNIQNILNSYIELKQEGVDLDQIKADAVNFLASFINFFTPPTIASNKCAQQPFNEIAIDPQAHQRTDCTFLLVCNSLNSLATKIDNNELFPDDNSTKEELRDILSKSFGMIADQIKDRQHKKYVAVTTEAGYPSFQEENENFREVLGRKIYYSKGLVTKIE